MSAFGQGVEGEFLVPLNVKFGNNKHSMPSHNRCSISIY